MSCTREMAAPIMTPRKRPEPRTPSRAAIATTNSGRLAYQRCFSAVDLEQPDDRHKNDGRKNRLRKGAQVMRKKKNDNRG